MARLGAALGGVVLAGALVAGLTAPLVGRPARLTAVVRPRGPAATALAWPGEGTAALYVPSAGVSASHHDHVVPIASLTKMMTVLVALTRRPLAPGEVGPCLVVGAAQVASYERMVARDESSVPVVVGERLCESQLLAGTLVRSAGDYASMLATMAAGSPARMVGLMNERARVMGLRHTHYAGVAGLGAATVSTARDQARVAAALMRYAVVRALVDESSVTLPVAGTVASYTPFVGEGSVVGVKSGRTAAAGGCDAMAVTFRAGGRVHTLYAVVTGQRTGNVLAAAGEAARALAASALAARRTLTWRPGDVLARVGFGEGSVAVTVARTLRLSWWPEPGAIHYRVVARRLLEVRRGEVVGRLVVTGELHRSIELVAASSLARPSWLERLR
ncbi:MAG TPA: hypothetical protein PLS29_07020 [Acidimicrobiales bacterium]|nr:hypothetical protein [Acidimicrobiales bacterium]